jgi:hypothetical protein
MGSSNRYRTAVLVAAGLLALGVLAPGVLAGGARASHSFQQARSDCRSFGGMFSATTAAWSCSRWIARDESSQIARGQRLFADCFAVGGRPGTTFADPTVQGTGYPRTLFTPCLAVGA